MKRYSIIYADPPWQYKANRRSYIANTSGEAQVHYTTMTIDDIKSLAVEELASTNCMLFIWVTFPLLQEGLDVIRAWGFTYKTLGFSWLKTTKDGIKPTFGVGYYTRSNLEVCLLGVRGKASKESSSISSVVVSPREAHSQKPDLVRDKIVQLCGDIPRVELFARQKVDGWDAWGDSVNSDIILGVKHE